MFVNQFETFNDLAFVVSSTRSYVEGREGNRGKAAYCKNPRGCMGIVVMDDDADISNACCNFCSYCFCSACDLSRHAPASCQQIVKWEELDGYLETGSEEEILARQCKLKTTKPCPKCSVRIEKNGTALFIKAVIS